MEAHPCAERRTDAPLYVTYDDRTLVSYLVWI